MLYIGDKVRITTSRDNRHSGKVGVITGKNTVTGIYGREHIKYRIRCENETLYYKERFLELVEPKVDDSLIEWMERPIK